MMSPVPCDFLARVESRIALLTPSSTVKKSLGPPLRTTLPGQGATPAQGRGSLTGAKRVSVGRRDTIEPSSVRKPGPLFLDDDQENALCHAFSAAVKIQTAKKPEKKEEKASAKIDAKPMGLITSLTPVRASKIHQRELGSNAVLTPVRRSARKMGDQANENATELLKKTNFAYVGV